MEGTTRVTVQEAARLLGISEGAVRARIHRGTLETAREGGTVYVRIDAEDTPKERTEQTELVQALHEHNTTLERQLNAEREARISHRCHRTAGEGRAPGGGWRHAGGLRARVVVA